MEITDAANNQNKKLVSIDVAIKYIYIYIYIYIYFVAICHVSNFHLKDNCRE